MNNYTKEQLEKDLIESNFQPCHFVKNEERLPGDKYPLRRLLIIKGKIIEPSPLKKVIEYKVEV